MKSHQLDRLRYSSFSPPLDHRCSVAAPMTGLVSMPEFTAAFPVAAAKNLRNIHSKWHSGMCLNCCRSRRDFYDLGVRANCKFQDREELVVCPEKGRYDCGYPLHCHIAMWVSVLWMNTRAASSQKHIDRQHWRKINSNASHWEFWAVLFASTSRDWYALGNLPFNHLHPDNMCYVN